MQPVGGHSQFVMPQESLIDLLDAVEDEATFLRFLDALARDRSEEEAKEAESPSNPYGPGHNGWEHGTIGDYLEAASAWAESSKNGLPLMPKEHNPWKRVAHILHAGKIYE